jgi:hypothetical protein
MFAAPAITEDVVAAAEAAIGLPFPPVFRRALCQYSFEPGSAGYVSFHFGQKLTQLVKMNTGADRWWQKQRGGIRFIFIADTDGWTILLNTTSDLIVGLEYGAPIESITVLATDILSFLACSCAIAVNRGKQEWISMDRLTDAANLSHPFWNQLAEGTA